MDIDLHLSNFHLVKLRIVIST